MRTIYFFTSPLCQACEEWKPVIEAFIAKNHPGIFVIKCNPNLKPYVFGKWRVKYTPSAAVSEKGEVLRYIEGKLLSLEELEEFALGPAEEDEDEEDEDEEEGEDASEEEE